MTKPWDNEPTPFSDRLVDEHGDFFISQTTVENLERRLRHAEKLLRECLEAGQDIFCSTQKSIWKHLEAANKEDGR